MRQTLDDFIAEERQRSPAFAVAFDKLAMAEKLREARKAAGMSQVALAKSVGTTQPAIARLESGTVIPRLDLLQRVAVALGRHLRIELVAGRDHRARAG